MYLNHITTIKANCIKNQWNAKKVGSAGLRAASSIKVRRETFGEKVLKVLKTLLAI